MTYRKPIKMLTQNLNEMLKNSTVNSSLFSPEQLKKLKSSSDKISGLKWHHQDLGRMQLVPTICHSKTGHIGGKALSQRGKINERINT